MLAPVVTEAASLSLSFSGTTYFFRFTPVVYDITVIRLGIFILDFVQDFVASLHRNVPLHIRHVSVLSMRLTHAIALTLHIPSHFLFSFRCVCVCCQPRFKRHSKRFRCVVPCTYLRNEHSKRCINVDITVRFVSALQQQTH